MAVTPVEDGGYVDLNYNYNEANTTGGPPPTTQNTGYTNGAKVPDFYQLGYNTRYRIASASNFQNGTEAARFLSDGDNYKVHKAEQADGITPQDKQTQDFVRAIEEHKDDPEWLKQFFAGIGPEKLVGLVSKATQLGPQAKQTVANGLAIAMKPGAVNQKPYVVKKGDYLYKIIDDYNKEHPNAKITLDDLLKLNPQIKNPDLIYPDQFLKLPTVDDTGNWNKFNTQFVNVAMQNPHKAEAVAGVIALMPSGHPLKTAFVNTTVNLGLNYGPTEAGGPYSPEILNTTQAHYARAALIVINNDPNLSRQFNTQYPNEFKQLDQNARYERPNTKQPNTKQPISRPHGKGF